MTIVNNILLNTGNFLIEHFKYSHHTQNKWQLWGDGMLISLIVEIISLFICISNHATNFKYKHILFLKVNNNNIVPYLE